MLPAADIPPFTAGSDCKNGYPGPSLPAIATPPFVLGLSISIVAIVHGSNSSAPKIQRRHLVLDEFFPGLDGLDHTRTLGGRGDDMRTPLGFREARGLVEAPPNPRRLPAGTPAVHHRLRSERALSTPKITAAAAAPLSEARIYLFITYHRESDNEGRQMSVHFHFESIDGSIFLTALRSHGVSDGCQAVLYHVHSTY
ncbi:hypothetical protein LshimejAT787_0400160 [Lyophyllum shimeji]|uniref:Uncharacterized protein n=1 Tax=Lyophyllum shimeji TaxID=47721 RepID=A0A9P3PJ98_LYOSH|nr:hypothetical protein LshimejAT787_0400160 [Lyophyllum shimeji]